jgi:hypothetical protein
MYLTRAFTFYGKASARALLRAMEETPLPKKDDKKSLVVAGFIRLAPALYSFGERKIILLDDLIG